MAALRTALVKRRHAYTSADIPWALDVDATGDADDVLRHGRWRLFHWEDRSVLNVMIVQYHMTIR